jgi:hypothetical protein
MTTLSNEGKKKQNNRATDCYLDLKIKLMTNFYHII